MTEHSKKINLSLESLVCRHPDQIFSKIDDEVVLLNTAVGEYISFNQTASRIWEIILKPTKIADLVEILALEYSVDISVCTKETMECIEQMITKKLITLG